MELAAMASAAVPGLTPTGVAGSPDDAADFDAALLIDDAGRRWRVRSPKHLEASMRLETELLVLRTFVPAVRAELPFALPYVAGTVRQGELCTFVYSHLPGAIRSIDTLMTSGRSVATEIGRAMAAIHAIPRELVTTADLPSYSANEFRQRRLNELDQAATTGMIPSVLLRRWEHALEDVSLWRFKPTVVHGDLHEDNILLTGERVSAVTGWTDLRVGDPADDFAWLIAANDPRFTEAVHGAYLLASTDPEDPHLIRRAALSAEFALAQWLVRGVAAENQTMVDEAVEMLGTLEEDVRAQEVSDTGAGQARESRSDAPKSGGAQSNTTRSSAANPGPGTKPKTDAGKVTVAPIPADGAPATEAAESGSSEAAEAVVIPMPARPDSGTENGTATNSTPGADEAVPARDADGDGSDGAADDPSSDDGASAESSAVSEDGEASAAETDEADSDDADSANSDSGNSDPGNSGSGKDTGSGKATDGPGTATTALPLIPVPDK